MKTIYYENQLKVHTENEGDQVAGFRCQKNIHENQLQVV